MSDAAHTLTAAAVPVPVPARAFLPGELRTLGDLLDALEGERIRLYVTADGRLVSDGPRSAMTAELRARIAKHRAALIRALRMAGAIGEDGPRVPSAIGACHDATHPRPPDYSYTLGRWLCVTCEPDAYALFVHAVRRAYDARTPRAGAPLDVSASASGEALDAGDVGAIIRAAIPRLDRGPLMRELLAWGEAHDWPQLPYAWRTGAGEDHRWYKAIMAGAAAWRRFVTGNPAAELLAAQRAAAAYPATPGEPAPISTGTPSTLAPAARRVENNPARAQCVVCGGDIAPCQGQRVDRDPLAEYGAAFAHPSCLTPDAPATLAPAPATEPAAAPDASMIADRAPDGPSAQAGTGASLEERDTPAQSDADATAQSGASASGEAQGAELHSDPPREWAECFAALDTGGLWLARIGDHSVAGPVERRELDDLTRPDPPDAHASARRLLAYMERERITQLWVHPTWAAAAGLPAELLADRSARDGMPHAFAVAAWANDGSGAGGGALWGMYHAGRIAPWMKFYRKGEAGTLAIVLPHLDGRVPWRTAADARELLAAVLAYRAALRGLAYRSGPGATSSALLRVVHRGSSAALDLTASAAPADFPAPARLPGLTPQYAWIRERTAEERERGRYVCGLDKHGMFLAACSSLRVGLDARPVHLDAADPALAPQLAAAVEALTDMHSRPRPKRPVGYWLARVTFPAGAVPAWLSAGLLPHPCYAGPAQPDPGDSWQWYVSATLELAAELGAHVEAREAHLWPRESIHEPLEPWYQRLRDARAELMRDAAAAAPGDRAAAAALALAAVKTTYAQGIGWLDASWLRRGEAPADLYRPDWRHAAIATANANLLRNLARGYTASGGRHAPIAILTDCAYYVTDTPDPLALAAELSLRMGEGLGHYHVKLAAFPLDGAELAPVWELQAAGRDPGRVASAFASAIHESEE